MSNGPFVKIPIASAAEICSGFDVPSEARKLLQDGMAPNAFVEALIAKQQYVPAIDFMAHALPLREGLWWGCLCLQHACGDDLTLPERAAATAAVQWVLQPGAESQNAAKGPAEIAGPATPAGSLAMAVTQTGTASAKGVANAVKLAALKGDPSQMARRQKAFADLAVEVAEGHLL